MEHLGRRRGEKGAFNTIVVVFVSVVVVVSVVGFAVVVVDGDVA